MKNTLFLLIALFIQIDILAEDTRYTVEVDGTTLYYFFNGDGGVTITSTNTRIYYEDGTSQPYGTNEYYGDIIIPSYITNDGVDYPVTRIGDYAFKGCFELTSVVIPETVTKIGDRAFSTCSELSSVNIPEGVTSIGEYAFSSCSLLTSITIPSTVTKIEAHAFYSCRGLTTLNLSEGLKRIEEYAFNLCYALTSVVIPESVYYIGTCAFSECSSLTSVYFRGVHDVYTGAFHMVSDDCILYVPTGTKDLYVSALSDTFDSDHIVELSADQFPSAIPTVTTTTKSVVGYYDLSGRKLTAPTGVTIIRYSDGTAEKILAK